MNLQMVVRLMTESVRRRTALSPKFEWRQTGISGEFQEGQGHSTLNRVVGRRERMRMGSAMKSFAGLGFQDALGV